MATPAPIHTGRHACTVGLKSLFKLINDRSPEGRQARKFFEQTKTTVQCQRVLTTKDFCWLCQGKFESPDPRLKPNCEHVLPIAQGVIFLQLYSSKHADITEAMELEYEWAHAICNNVKNSTVLIKGEESNFQPDVEKIEELIKKLRSNGVTIQDDQVFNIQGRLMAVTDYINKNPDLAINNSELCPIRLIFKTGGKSSKRKHNGRIVRKTTVRRNVATSRTHRKIRTSIRKRT